MNIGQEEYLGWLRLDPRTKLLYVMTVGCFCLTLAGGDARVAIVTRQILALSPCVLLLVGRRLRLTVIYVATVAGSYLSAVLLLPRIGGFIGWLAYASIGILTQVLPGAMATYWMLSTTTVGELVAAFQRMHIPQAITIPLAVMFRFFPTAVDEQRAINDAMTMRGIRFGGDKAGRMLEYRVVPLLTNTVRIADELSQAALTRGLSARRHRTSVANIGFHAVDVFMIMLCMACLFIWLLVDVKMLR